MLRVSLAVILALPCFLAVALSPLAAAWTLREAIAAGNSVYVDRAIAWETVRETLRASMKSMALDRPITPLAAAVAGDTNRTVPPRQGWWARFKGNLTERAVDGLIRNYANAKGLPTLFSVGQTYKRVTFKTTDKDPSLAEPLSRLVEFWSRVRHAELVSPTCFEIEIQSKDDPTRRISGLFEFRDWRWQLTQLYVHSDRHPLGRIATLAKPLPQAH